MFNLSVTIIDEWFLYFTCDSAFQVNNLLQVAQKYQAAASESGPAGVSNNDAQTICNMLVNRLCFIFVSSIVYLLP
jgi:hypothetical protein